MNRVSTEYARTIIFSPFKNIHRMYFNITSQGLTWRTGASRREACSLGHVSRFSAESGLASNRLLPRKLGLALTNTSEKEKKKKKFMTSAGERHDPETEHRNS